MMDGKTALLLMRAKRERDELEMAQPHIDAKNRANAEANEQRQARLMLERLLQSKMLPYLAEGVGMNIGREAYKEIMKVVCAQKSFSGTTTITVPTGMLLEADSKSVVARVVDWWKLDVAPKMSVATMMDVQDRGVMVLDVRLPAMGYRERVLDF